MRLRLLFLATVQLAMEDYRAGKLAWGYFLSRDFRFCCTFAEVDPEVVRATLRESIIYPRRPVQTLAEAQCQ